MSTNEKDVAVAVSTMTLNPHFAAAQQRLRVARGERELIPNFVLPVSPRETQRLSIAASVSPQFVEASASAMANESALGRASITPDEMRDQMAYAEAYGPLADEYEAMAQFLRHSIAAARNYAGSEALATYHNAKRLAKIPRYAGLAPYVADMRRTLGKMRGKPTLEQLEKRAATAVAKAEKARELAARKLQASEPADPA